MTGDRHPPGLTGDEHPPGLTGDEHPADGTGDGHPADQPVRRAMLAYLGVPVAGIIPPLAVYLVSWRRPAFVRGHVAEALRAASAATLYGVCLLILAAMLALDSVKVAVIVVGPLVVALWLVIVVLCVRAARAARSGDRYEFPGWLRVSQRDRPLHDRG